MAMPVFREPSLQEAFAERGYVVVQLLTPTEAAELAAGVAALADARGAAANTRGPTGTYHVSLHDTDAAYRAAACAMVREALVGRVQALTHDYRFLNGGFLIKPAGADSIEVHRDWTMTRDPRHVALNCWCPLVDVDEENGSLAVLEGSHCLVDNVEGPRIPPFFEAYRESLRAPSRKLTLRAGEAVILDYRLLHWSTANRTGAPRLAIAGGFVPATARAVLYLPDPGSGGKRFNIIEPSAADWMDALNEAIDPSGCRIPVVGSVKNRNRQVGQAAFEAMLAGRAPARRPLLARLLQGTRTLLRRDRAGWR